jgi:hypothetical protein
MDVMTTPGLKFLTKSSVCNRRGKKKQDTCKQCGLFLVAYISYDEKQLLTVVHKCMFSSHGITIWNKHRQKMSD